MSEQSEFEQYKDKCIGEVYGSGTYADGLSDGMDLARDWIINEAHRLAYTDGYLRPSDLEEACK